MADAKNELERRVQTRTAELQTANHELHTEIAQRKSAQEELRRSEVELRGLAGKLISVQEDERKRIARDLHDDFSQRLALHCLKLDLLRQSLPAGSETAHKLQQARSDANELAIEVRRISHNLHHPQLALGLQHGIASFCREFSEQFGIAVDVTQEGDLVHLPESVSIVLFRVLQEALGNVAKHSGADRVTVFVSAEGDRALLRATDRGQGFETQSVRSGRGLGLISMRERLRLVGGSLRVTSFPEQGTDIEAAIPITMPGRPQSAFS